MLHGCSVVLPEVILNNAAILRVSSLVVSLKLAEEAHRRSTMIGIFYKRLRQVLCVEHCFIAPPLRKGVTAERNATSSATSERVVTGYLDDHDAQPVRISYLHLA